MKDATKVKLIIGSHGSGKSDWIYNRFLDMSRNQNDKSKIDLNKKFILIVPEQDTNDKQRTMIKKSIEKGFGSGILNIDVVSFDRIAHNVFEILNIEPIKENVIDDDMKTMILSLVLSKLAKANKLKFCDKMVNRVGFARKLTQVVSEFYAYSVSSDDIDKVISAKKSDIYRDKLNDFKLIFDEFKKVLIDMHFSIKEDKYDLLDKRIEDVNIFDNAIVAFDGFTGFTPIQLSIFKKIVSKASEVFVAVDYRDPVEIKTFNVESDIEDTDLFYLSKKFIKDIAGAIDTKNIEDLLCVDSIKDTVLKYSDEKYDLSFIEQNIYRTNYEKEDIDVKNIDYFVADNIREEVLNVVQRIFDLVRNKGYKYNDIRIVVPQIENYRNFIIKAFDKYNIPLFIDDSERIINSPYIETIRSALDVINYNFSYESIMRYINSGINEKNREVYEFDNFVLEHAIRGFDRYKTGFEKIKIPDDKKEKIYNIKKNYIKPLIMLYEDLQGDKSINNYIKALISFIENSELNKKYEILDKQIDDMMEKDISYSRISAIFKYSKEVVENIINDLSNLEKYKEKDKSEYLSSDISIEEFRRMFDAGLSNKALKSIPFSLDQVVVGDLMRSRFDNPKIEFFLGLNQSAVPSKNSDFSLIDDAIRELFAKNVKELSQTTIETTLNQRFYIYLAMTNPTDKLILSFTKVSSEGDSDEKSPVLI
ncbi:MAG: exodeoxyribonuclease V subunit gamma, partial [Lachnospiraceae bacterium]|nr:exodeoxyribonuclease V subunit gamma [Lachnospiraceae bacterium]